MELKKHLLLVGATVFAASAYAVPTLDAIQGGAPSLESHSAEYFSLSDTDGTSDDFFAMITLEQASYESNLGIYSFSTDGLGNVTVLDSLQVFQASDEPGFGSIKSVNFDLLSSIAYLDDDGVVGYSAGDSQANIGKDFGFYLNVTNTGNTFYSHTSLNGDGVDHLGVYETAGQGGSTNYFDVVLAWEDIWGGGDQDYTDMVVGVNDIIPIPEPGTLALIGLGLAGLGAARRRKAA